MDVQGGANPGRQRRWDAAQAIDWLGFGRYQQKHFWLMALVWIPVSFPILMMYYVDAPPEINCFEADANVNNDVSFSNNEMSDCFKDSCLETGGTFELIDPDKTIAVEFGLVCGQDYKRGMVGSAFFVGFLFGTSVIGSWSSNYGRRKAFWIALGLLIITGGLCVLARSYRMYLTARFFTGFAAGGLGLVSYVLGQEFIASEYLNLANTIAQALFSLGGVLLTPLAYVTNSWRTLTLVSTLPLLLFVPFYQWLEESPSWLQAHGRLEESRRVVEKVARGNGVSLDDELFQSFDDSVDNDDEDADASIHSHKDEHISIFGPRYRWITLCSFFNWFTVSLVYYGLSLSAGSLGGNKYLSFLKSLVVELPSYVVAYVLLEYFARKSIMAASFALAGVACLGVVSVDVLLGSCNEEANYKEGPDEEDGCQRDGLKSLLAMLGKMGITIAFNCVYIITFELYPPHSRSTAMGMCSSASRLGGILAPLVALLGETRPQLPGVIFSLFGILSSLFTLVAITETKVATTQSQPGEKQHNWLCCCCSTWLCCKRSSQHGSGGSVEYELVDTHHIKSKTRGALDDNDE